MTRVAYHDRSVTSPDGRFTLEARSSDNGTIPLPNGQPAPVREGERWHQRNFRYQLLDTATRRVCWERWQGEGEASAGALLVSNDGWSILQTAGFYPEFIAVSPRGTETLRARIYPIYDDYGPVAPPAPLVHPTTPMFDWPAFGARESTAGVFWDRHSVPYFIRHAGQPYYVCRTAWDERLVLRLEPAALIPHSEQQGTPLAEAMDEEEKRLARVQLERLRPLLDSPQVPNQNYTLDPLRVALHLAGVHHMTDCLPLIRPWDRFDLPAGGMGSRAFGNGKDGCYIQTQALRPILNHSLQHLGVSPSSLPAYAFDLGQGGRLPVSVLPVEERAARVSAVDSSMSARQLLELMGAPDHVSQEDKREPGFHGCRRLETWEFDFLLPPGWQTLTVLWESEDGKGRITQLKQGASPWLQYPYRSQWILKPA